MIAGIGVELDQEQEAPNRLAISSAPPSRSLHVGGMHDRVHQQALGADENVALLALDLLARIIARRIGASPPSHRVFPVKLIHFGIVEAPRGLDP